MKCLRICIAFLYLLSPGICCRVQAQTTVKHGVKYDTIIRKHVDPVKKTVSKPVSRPPEKAADTAKKNEITIPVPEFINQPYFYDRDGNKLAKLENATAQLATKKKTLGLKGARQSLAMDGLSSKIRFTSKKDISFIIKTSGDVIDLTSYIKLYQFFPADQKREVTINAKEGLFTDKEESKGKLMNFGVRMISPDNYMLQVPGDLPAGEYGFVWVKNMDLKEFTVFAFGIDWRNNN